MRGVSTQSPAVLKNSNGADNVGFGSETVAQNINRSQALNKMAMGELDRPATYGAMSLIVESILNKKPDVKNLINEKISRALSSDYCGFRSARSFGATVDSVVIGDFEGIDGGSINPVAMFCAPIGLGVSACELSVSVDALGGADLDDVVIEYGVWRKNGGLQNGVRVAMIRVGNVWSASAVLVESFEGDLFGFHISSTNGDFALRDFYLKNSDGDEFGFGVDDAKKVFVHFVQSVGKRSVRINKFGVCEFRGVGVKSGRIPSCVYVSVDADASTGGTGATVGGTISAGCDYDYGCVPVFGLYSAEVYYRNGYRPPAVIFEAGVYVNYHDVAHLKTFGTLAFDHYGEFLIACPDGVAVLSAGASNSDGVIFGVGAGQVTPKYFLANVHCDETITRPFVALRVNLDGWNLSSVYSASEGINIDYGDVTLQECSFSGSQNDGVNSHESGHTTLIDCNCFLNLDDGFSPHDECTYSVYGGSFYENGKGNVIPAYGAKGFVIGAASWGSTGESSRVADISGVNDGGFVCLGDDSGVATSLVLINSSSSEDRNGIVSAGGNSFVFASSVGVSESVVFDFAAINWESSSGSAGSSGKIVSAFSNIDGLNVVDVDGRIAAFNNDVLGG